LAAVIVGSDKTLLSLISAIGMFGPAISNREPGAAFNVAYFFGFKNVEKSGMTNGFVINTKVLGSLQEFTLES
jgi:hypothetical protein